jgi:hypothetical protein
METRTEAFNTTTPVTPNEDLQYSWFSLAVVVVFFFFCCSCVREFLKELCRCELRERYCPCLDCDLSCDTLASCPYSKCTAVLRACSELCITKCSAICERFRVRGNSNVNSNVEVTSTPTVTTPPQFSDVMEAHTDRMDESPPIDETLPPSYDSIVSDPSKPPPSYEEVMR